MKYFYYIFFSIVLVLCLGADFLAPYPYYEQNLALGASAPSFSHIFGTDSLGRDIFSRVLFGGQISFSIGIFATLFATLIGVIYGTISGIGSKRRDYFMMRFIDISYSLPFTVLVIILTMLFGRSLVLLFVAIGAVEWLSIARITRGQVLELKSSQFVEASLVLGQSRLKIILKHILPNAKNAIAVCAILTMPSVMLLESFLSFLGLGVQAPLPSWGSLINEGTQYMQESPWQLIFPAIIFALSLFSINGISESLNKK
ncbi:MAG: ABC transporter permease [Opitutales bacterium]